MKIKYSIQNYIILLIIILCMAAACSRIKQRDETTGLQDSDPDEKAMLDKPGPLPSELEFTKSSRFERGENLAGKLRDMDVPANQTMMTATLLEKVHDIRSIPEGSMLQVCNSDSGLVRMVLTPPRSLVQYRVDRTSGKSFTVYADSLQVERLIIRREGEIESTFYEALLNNEGTPDLAVKFIEVFQFVIYFSSETRKGDRYRFIAEELRHNGKVLGYGRILAAQYINCSESLTAIWRPDSTSEFGGDYFNEEGLSFRRDLLRAPFTAARVTSTFGLRKHPISGDVKMHRGVDFGAKTGTPVVASGSGKIKRLVRGDTGLGNWVEIRHGKTGFTTRYGHFSRHARGLKKGALVKQGQIIGYVGMTGYATGPHLHYEVMRDGRNINPMKVKGSPVRKLNPEELDEFIRDRYSMWLQRLEQPDVVSSSDGIAGPQPVMAGD